MFDANSISIVPTFRNEVGTLEDPWNLEVLTDLFRIGAWVETQGFWWGLGVGVDVALPALHQQEFLNENYIDLHTAITLPISATLRSGPPDGVFEIKGKLSLGPVISRLADTECACEGNCGDFFEGKLTYQCTERHSPTWAVSLAVRLEGQATFHITPRVAFSFVPYIATQHFSGSAYLLGLALELPITPWPFVKARSASNN